MARLHIDIETYSSENLATSGVYKYARSGDFEILLFAYAFDSEPVTVIDLAQGEMIPPEVERALTNPFIKKHAHNATFERVCLAEYGYEIPASQWSCTMVKSAYCGLPLKLEILSKVLNLGLLGKLEGNRLIKFFCTPCKPTKINGGRTRNLPIHDLEKWETFKTYNANDVEAERQVVLKLKPYKLPRRERQLYNLDQRINDEGVQFDRVLAEKCIEADEIFSLKNVERLKELTGLDNPNSPAQLKEWLKCETGQDFKSLKSELIPRIISSTDSVLVGEVLNLRLANAKTSTSKYLAMINCASPEDRIRGLLQFYGANRTGRWAGRLVQIHNLPRNSVGNLDDVRQTMRDESLEDFELIYGSSKKLISELVRTAFVARPGRTLAVADFNAIEARVTAWFAGEEWKLNVFRTGGKIYETAASLMFGVPVEQIDKGSELRQKGKIAELALGYGGGKGALAQMDKKGVLQEAERQSIVNKWRNSNPNIVKLWRKLEKAALATLTTREKHTAGSVYFSVDKFALKMHLPSGRELYYCKPSIGTNRFNKPCIKYWGLNQQTKQWVQLETYGGKLAENLSQAFSRDLLAESMLNVSKEGYTISMHVHDENVCEVPIETAESDLNNICEIMAKPIKWAEGLPLKAAGFVSEYYQKD